MKPQTLFVAGLALAIACVIAVVVISQRQARREAELAKLNQAHRAQVRMIAAPTPAPVLAPEPPAAAPVDTTPPPAKAAPEIKPKPQKAAPAKASASQATKDPEPQDPMARVALSFVGADPDADEYWANAINDPSLSADERQNLIEDLNEDGLSDPKNPSPEDLPLILNRLRLIEEMGPFAMDKINFDAFNEAYKDLMNLADRATGGNVEIK